MHLPVAIDMVAIVLFYKKIDSLGFITADSFVVHLEIVSWRSLGETEGNHVKSVEIGGNPPQT
jgi:hypothetical protein